MLDYSAHQAVGLRGLAPPPGPHLMAMVSHGDTHAELPLLWQLCDALVALSYPVTVLDATQRETQTEPGLYQELEYSFRRTATAGEALAWNVLPAAVGMQSMCAASPQKKQHLHRLGQIFPHNGVVILYSKADWLATLLSDSGMSPLLAVSSQKNSLITSYLALKRLLLNARLEPTILHMMDRRLDSDNVTSHLSACAKNFLDYEVKALNIDMSADERRLGLAVRRLAAHLLETALPLSTLRLHSAFLDGRQERGHFARA